MKETLRYQPYDQDKYPVPNCTLYRQYILILTIRSHGGREMMRRLCTARSSFACNTRRSSVLAVDNPFTGETYVEVPVESAEETVRKVERSAAAQRVFAAETSLEDRIALCARFMEAFEADKERIAQDITGQMGKPFHNALGEVRGMFERCEGMMALAPAALAPEVVLATAAARAVRVVGVHSDHPLPLALGREEGREADLHRHMGVGESRK